MTASTQGGGDEPGWLNRQQGSFGEQLIRVLAAAGGISTSRPDIDLGFDVNLEAADGDMARLQVKTTRQLVRSAGDQLHFEIDVPTYDRLRRQLSIPSFLILVEVPDARREWASVTNPCVILKHRARYVSLQGLPPTPNTSSVTVSLPIVNMVTPDALRAMAEGELR